MLRRHANDRRRALQYIGFTTITKRLSPSVDDIDFGLDAAVVLTPRVRILNHFVQSGDPARQVTLFGFDDFRQRIGRDTRPHIPAAADDQGAVDVKNDSPHVVPRFQLRSNRGRDRLHRLTKLQYSVDH